MENFVSPPSTARHLQNATTTHRNKTLHNNIQQHHHSTTTNRTHRKHQKPYSAFITPQYCIFNIYLQKLNAAMNENGDEFIWSEGPFSSTKHRPLLNNMLHKIETYSLLCPSCHEFYENAVTLRPCHHSFCSKCIRRHLCVRNGVKHQRCCPVCNSKIEIRKMNGQSKKLDDDDAIIPNHGLQVRSAED